MKSSSFLFLALGIPLVAGAVDFSCAGTDAAFAERYAFATNRAALIATLQPETPAWFFYSVLNAQTEGRLAEAQRLLDRWDYSAVARDFWRRQVLLAFDAAKPDIDGVRTALGSCGITVTPRNRETALAPNTYPSVLDPAKVSFASFEGKRLAKDFWFLPLLPDFNAPSGDWRFNPMDEELLPDTPGLEASLIGYLREPRNRGAFRDGGVYRKLTLDQLMRLAEALKGSDNDLYGNRTYATIVLRKLSAGAEDDFAADPAAEKALLARRVAFVRTLGFSLNDIKAQVYAEMLAYGRRHGEELALEELFRDYLRVNAASRGPNPRPYGLHELTGLKEDYLAALRRAGSDLSDYALVIEEGARTKFLAKVDLLAGRAAEEANAQVLTAHEFKALRARVELAWSPANPALFAANDDVKLTLDVKNVPRLHVAVYELDAFDACCAAGGEVKGDIDLDGAVPTVSRTVDYARYAAMVRHTETLDFPELKEPGLYVVECSGEGVCSRALIRKGRLRVTERRDAAGHVFTALDEKGRVVKGTKLRLGETVFLAEPNGEIPVPFAADEKSAGRKCAVVGDGRLASTVSFDHVAETVALEMALVLPDEALVAGRRATALIRPKLLIAGTLAPLELLKDARLTLRFTDLDGQEVSRSHPAFRLADDAESEVSFVVPPRLATVAFTLTGKVRKATADETVTLSACGFAHVNGICRTVRIPQLFLRRTADGYVLEMRGRTGEPLAARAVEACLEHRVFEKGRNLTLQTDAEGRIHLGRLPDIRAVRVACGEHEETWRLTAPRLLPDALSVAEGETVELPVRDLLAGEWPGAGRLAARLSFLAYAANGEIAADCLSACSYANGVLRLTGLKAGDYRLRLRDGDEACAIHVVKTAEGVREGGVRASATRAVTDVGGPARLRIAAASLAADGVLTVKLANAAPGTRVHLFASRTFPSDEGNPNPACAFGRTLERPPMTESRWGRRTAEYVSGRDLGEKLRYVFDRRDQPGRVGNLLDRPSLLLNPWNVSETATAETNLRDGEDWRQAEAHGGLARQLEARNAPLAPSMPCCSRRSSPCCDFLPQAATVVANARPDEQGVVTINVAAAGEAGIDAQDLTVIATDGCDLDVVSILGKCVAYVPRDLSYGKIPGDAGAAAQAQSRTCSTHDELFDFMEAGEFAFLRGWPEKTEAEKRNLYDTYASHELDFYLYEQDRPFFESVVKPHLANKRLKRFVDRWLLGEDVSSYATPGVIDNLNAFEQCLLARRLPALAQQIARRYADWCAANPVEPARLDEAYNRVLGVSTAETQTVMMEDTEAVDLADLVVAVEACADEAEADEAKPNGCADARAYRGVRRLDNSSERKARAVARRANRQLYHPPKRTCEWVETHYFHRRSNEPTKDLVSVNSFWRDYAAAIAAGTTESFASENILFADESLTERIVACALVKRPITFTRPILPSSGALQITERCYGADSEKAVADEFIVGRPYFKKTVLMNPTDADIRESVLLEIPVGAMPLAGARAAERCTVAVKGLSVQTLTQDFYFPQVVGNASFAVVAAPTKTDTTSWAHVSQEGTKGEVLDYLKTRNLAAPEVDLAKIAWRMKDGAYARKVLDILSARGFYNQELWLAGLLWRDAFDVSRIREALARRENQTRLAPRLGPVFVSPLVTITPEAAGLFEHKEYWPLINARAHAVAGGVNRIANRQLAEEYRAFLDTLAAKRTLSADDRLLAAVYLIAQDRFAEAKAQIAEVRTEDVGTKMQAAYLRAYLAFCEGDAEKGRALAAAFANHPVPHWQKRFREVLAQADEIAGRSSAPADAEAGRAPTLALAFSGDAAVLTARNLAACTLSAYPIDLEILFTKDPFGAAKKAGASVRCLKPLWRTAVQLADGSETRVPLPPAVRARPLVLVATGAEGRAEASLEVSPRILDVQVSREYRQLRVRGADGKALAGAYVKVYVKDASGREVRFHKDGYTDLRGIFDYASVSTDSDFRPSEYAILVLHDAAGVKTLNITTADERQE
ncbi:MAG: hypothetical protein ACI4R9_04805 [Kiritimatiellia bacterium]